MTDTPNLPPQQPVGHSGLYPTLDTHWSISNGQVMVAQVNNGTAGAAQPFVFKGVRYQPTPIGIDGGAAGTPMGDFYYIGMQGSGSAAETMMFYQPIWARDVGPNGLIRQLGANNIGVYGSFNVPPATMPANNQPPSIPTPANNPPVNWTPLGPIRYVEAGGQMYPTYMPEGASEIVPPPYWYHYCHDGFLDMCWNGGINPIYVFLAVGVSPYAFYSSNSAPGDGYQYTQVQEYYLQTAEWLAECYGHHPALGGFYVTNETNQPGSGGTYQYLEYWDFLNKVGETLKKYAPNKLTIAAMQDDIGTLNTQLMQYTKKPAPGEPAPATELLYVTGNGVITPSPNGGVDPGSNVDCGAPNAPAYAVDAFKLDMWGWNLYAAAQDATPIIAYLKQRKAAGLAMAPLVISEIGIPQAMRYLSVTDSTTGKAVSDGPIGGNDPYVTNPNGHWANWTPGTSGDPGTLTVESYLQGIVLGQESLAIVSAKTNGPPPADFTSTAGYNAGGLVVYDNGGQKYYLYVGNPSDTTPTWTEINQTKYGVLLAAINALPAGQANAAGPAIALYAYLKAAANYQVGGSGVSSENELLQGVQVFEYVDEWYKWVDPSIANTSEEATAAGVHDFRDTQIAPWGPADAQFYTTWEEEWFGLCSALPNGRSSTSPAIGSDGWLAGNGADNLTPRASFAAVQLFFSD